MRVLTGLRKPAARRAIFCGTLEYSGFMDGRRKLLGRRLARARRKAGYRSQRALAGAIGISENSVANAERGADGVGDSVFTAIETGLGLPEEISKRYIDTGDDALLDQISAPDSRMSEASPVITAPSTDGDIDTQMFDHLMLVKDTMAESGAPRELLDRLINAEFRRWRNSVPDRTMFLRTWARWVAELNRIGVHGVRAESDYPPQTG